MFCEQDIKDRIGLCPRQEGFWGRKGIAPPILRPALDGGEWSTSHLCRFTPGSYRIGGWGGGAEALWEVLDRRTPIAEIQNTDGPARS